MTTPISGGLITLEYAATGLKYKDVGSTSSPDNTARDADLTAYVQAATPVIEDIIGSALSASKTVYRDGARRNHWRGYFRSAADTDAAAILISDRVQSITTVVENGVTLVAGTDYVFNTATNLLYRGSGYYPTGWFAPGIGNVVITYLAGYATVPANVQLATRELVRFWVQQGNESQRPAYGDGVESMAFTPQGFAVPKRVIELCAAEQRAMVGFA
jgi:hypothetical protein